MQVVDLIKIVYSTGVLGVAYLLAFILESLIPSDVKTAIIFWGNSKLPGNVVIDKLLRKKWKDVRLDFDETSLFLNDNFPKKHGNSEWYCMYTVVREEKMITGASSDFLFARDLFILTLEVMVMYLLIICTSTFEIKISILMVLGILLILTELSARILGKRLALNVIVMFMKMEANNHVSN